jgi:hypothetical protein
MSYSIDANLLLYCSDTSSPYHEAALKFLKEKTAEPEILYLAWPTAMAYLRISTHPRIFDVPLTPGQAVQNLASLVALPRVRMITEKDGFLETYQKQTSGLVVRGNLTPDAHLAVLLFQHGVKNFYTNDSDFARFPFLKIKHPFPRS